MDQRVLNINILAENIYHANKEKGFWDDIEHNTPATKSIAACGENVIAVATLIEHLRKGVDLIINPFNIDHLLPNQVKLLSKLALIVTEVAEAIDAYVDDPFNMQHLEEELADIHIRTFDIEGYLKTDSQKNITDKCSFNTTRPYKHGKLA